MKVTVLIENEPVEGLQSEHGLSLWLEYRGGRYLMDVGATGAFLENAARLGIPAEEADAVFLSHGHWDHTGGLPAFFEKNKKARVWARAEIETPLYHADGETTKYIGMPQGLPHEQAERFVLLTGDASPAPGLYLLGCEETGGAFGGQDPALREQGPDGLVPDRFRHEQCLAAEGEDGTLVLFSSCSHAGIVNIVRAALAAFPGKTVHAVVGGLHMMGPTGTDSMGSSEEFVRRVAAELFSLGVREVWTGHCTGAPALEVLAACGAPRVHRLYPGLSFEV